MFLPKLLGSGDVFALGSFASATDKMNLVSYLPEVNPVPGPVINFQFKDPILQTSCVAE